MTGGGEGGIDGIGPFPIHADVIAVIESRSIKSKSSIVFTQAGKLRGESLERYYFYHHKPTKGSHRFDGWHVIKPN